eukprot:3292-Heterococcus_DN1.PRE.4
MVQLQFVQVNFGLRPVCKVQVTFTTPRALVRAADEAEASKVVEDPSFDRSYILLCTSSQNSEFSIIVNLCSWGSVRRAQQERSSGCPADKRKRFLRKAQKVGAATLQIWCDYWLHDLLPLSDAVHYADVQYAPIEDGSGHSGRPRYYKNSLKVLAAACEAWNSNKVQFGVHLGDCIDGLCPKTESQTAMTAVVNTFKKYRGHTYHMLGNHCLYNLPRAELNEQLGISTSVQLVAVMSHAITATAYVTQHALVSDTTICHCYAKLLIPLLITASQEPDCSYYSFTKEGFRFIVLDCYDISAEGWDPEHPKSLYARSILDKINPNRNQNSPAGLDGLNQRFVRFGGAVGPRQLLWLKMQLEEAGDAK